MQALNGWGEVTANINERNFKKHPFGRFAFCLKGAKGITLPKGTQRVDLPSKKSRILMRIELGANPADAIALQKKVTMKATGSPLIDPLVVKLDFPNSKLPGVEGFDKAEEILASEPDLNVGMIDVRDKVRAVAKAAADPAQRTRIDEVIRKYAIPAFLGEIRKMGNKAVNGWVRPRLIGNYRTDYAMRTHRQLRRHMGEQQQGGHLFHRPRPRRQPDLYADLSHGCATRFERRAIFGRSSRSMAWTSKSCLIRSTVICSTISHRLKFNDDGSLTLAFAPKQPDDIPESNWLPTPNGRKYNLTYRFYGPAKDVSGGTYYPPLLVRTSETQTEKLIRSLKKSK